MEIEELENENRSYIRAIAYGEKGEREIKKKKKKKRERIEKNDQNWNEFGRLHNREIRELD